MIISQDVAVSRNNEARAYSTRNGAFLGLLAFIATTRTLRSHAWWHEIWPKKPAEHIVRVRTGAHGGRTYPHSLGSTDIDHPILGLGDNAGKVGQPQRRALDLLGRRDRKSTRLNSSHVKISYAVFCLKKKN